MVFKAKETLQCHPCDGKGEIEYEVKKPLDFGPLVLVCPACKGEGEITIRRRVGRMPA